MQAPCIAVIFDSCCSHVEQLAGAVADGAEDAGAEVRLRRVQELHPTETQPGTGELATVADLAWADGIALGTQAQHGAPAAALSRFLEAAEELGRDGELDGKLASSFGAAEHPHGGSESALLALNNVFYHWGCLIVAPGYTDPCVYAAGGNPYGASFAAADPAQAVSPESLGAAQHQGHRIARYAELLAGRR